MSEDQVNSDHDLDKVARFIKRQFSGDWSMPPKNKRVNTETDSNKISNNLTENWETDNPNKTNKQKQPIVNDPQNDYDKIVNLINRFETAYNVGHLDKQKIKLYQSELDKISNKYHYDESIAGLYCAFYELQALVYRALQNDKLALQFLNEADDIKSLNQNFISQAARDWYIRKLEIFEERKDITDRTATQMTNNKTKRFTPAMKFVFAGIAILLITLGVAARPLSDYYTIKDASPTMIKLAQDSGMSRKGELIFLRANPQLVNSTEMANYCSNVVSVNSNGFVTQGCYISSTNRIYILQMPSALYNVEVTTAAYEMLHPVYEDLVKDGDGSNLNQSIESSYSTNSDSFLTSQVSNFAKTEPDDRDLELFSLLGTGYSDLSANLSSYYNPYFTNLAIDVTDNDQIQAMFQNDASQLTQLEDTIANDENEANTAYYDSTTWAEDGDQYEDDYNYNIYVQDYDDAQNAYNQFKTLNQQYELLISEYNGQQFNQSAPTQSQQTQ